MKKYYSIGEMSKLNFVSIQTLRYYDKIGLLKPNYVEPQTGYRYYTYKEFLMLDTIHYLKLFGMSLEEIQHQFENRTISNSLDCLEKQLVSLQQNIQNMIYLEKRMQHNISNLKNSDHLKEKKEPEIISFPDRYMVSIHRPITTDEEYEVLIRSLSYKLYSNHCMAMGDFIGIKSKDDLMSGHFERSISIGTILENPISGFSTETLQGGDYACIYHFGSSDDAPKSYQRLCDYIKHNNYQIIGQCIEMYIVDMMDTKNSDEYIAHIQIPIAKRSF